MNVRTLLSLALVAIAFALGGCATASKDSSFDSKADGTVKKTEKATCTGWGCSDTSTSRRAPIILSNGGQYGSQYGYWGGAGAPGYNSYGGQSVETIESLAQRGFTFYGGDKAPMGVENIWTFAKWFTMRDGTPILKCWAENRGLTPSSGWKVMRPDGIPWPICFDHLTKVP
jgi:hypothetical protein